jgi:hypothetical protein
MAVEMPKAATTNVVGKSFGSSSASFSDFWFRQPNTKQNLDQNLSPWTSILSSKEVRMQASFGFLVERPLADVLLFGCDKRRLSRTLAI